ncbi:MAG: hypothetical protein RIS21_1313 [Planctomycetota bacterium]|jgi:uncharacterized protein YbaR (Trm112 family)
MPVDPGLLAILRCPASRATLVVDGDRLVSTDAATRRAYRIEDGDLPIMVVEESTVLSEEDWNTVMVRCGART